MIREIKIFISTFLLNIIIHTIYYKVNYFEAFTDKINAVLFLHIMSLFYLIIPVFFMYLIHYGLRIIFKMHKKDYWSYSISGFISFLILVFIVYYFNHNLLKAFTNHISISYILILVYFFFKENKVLFKK